MRLVRSSDCKGAVSKPSTALPRITEDSLRQWVRTMAVPRNFMAETVSNQNIASWISSRLMAWGYDVQTQGDLRNIVAIPKALPSIQSELILVGAHYDSVPQTPGADDNASAVAAMLACAEALSHLLPRAGVCFVAFNCEESGYEGSRDFVERYLSTTGIRIRHAHILEMLGYASNTPGTQKVPTALPIQLPDAGNFLGLLSDKRSGPVMDNILKQAGTRYPDLSVLGLEVPLGMEKCLPVLARSDHIPFWERQIPAVMWTDTAEFRNPNYHKETDTPETLNYPFLRACSELLLCTIAGELGCA